MPDADGSDAGTGTAREDRIVRGIELTPEHPIADVADHAVAAERAGFDTVVTSCHYFNRDPFLTLGRIAAATEDVRLGPAAANPYDTHPVALASRMATLTEAADGRTVFGVGPGDRSALSSLGVDYDRPLRRVLETIRVARTLWDGDAVDHDGTFAADGAALEYSVGSIPVYVGAQGPHMLRMSAKHADGILFNGSHPDDYAWAADRVAEGLAERPDDRGDADFVGYASLSVDADPAAAREAARPAVAFIAAGAAPPVLDRHGLDRDAVDHVRSALSAGDLRTAFDRVTPAMVDAFCIAGTPEDVAEKTAAVLEYADGLVVGTPLGPDLSEAIPRAARAVGCSRRE